MEYPLVKAQISLAAVKNNIHALKSMITKKSKFMAVVKADAYGHGAVNIAKHALLSGADTLGVARLDEAVELRDAGITAPLLVFGYIYPLQAALVHDLNLTVTIYNYDMAKALSKAASQQGVKIQTHLKIDTGMGRVGMIVNNLNVTRKKTIEHIKKTIELPGIEIQGIYTHLAAADHKERTYTNQQLNLFDSLLSDLKKENIEFEICHAANSAGILEYPDSHYNMVRAGISLYGLYPSMEIDTSRVNLIPVMTLKSVITSLRKVSSGFKVSYGMTHETSQDTLLASVPIGYADGFSRLFSSKGYMLVKGEKAPIVGRVCMDQTIIDVGHIPDVQVEDEVVLIGRQGDKAITADELAQNINTINYEIVSSLTPRVKRVYY